MDGPRGCHTGEVSQIEKEKYFMTSLICGIRKEMIQKNLQSRKILTDLDNELMVVREGGRNS